MTVEIKPTQFKVKLCGVINIEDTINFICTDDILNLQPGLKLQNKLYDTYSTINFLRYNVITDTIHVSFENKIFGFDEF
jgi:hypothetical protein